MQLHFTCYICVAFLLWFLDYNSKWFYIHVYSTTGCALHWLYDKNDDFVLGPPKCSYTLQDWVVNSPEWLNCNQWSTLNGTVNISLRLLTQSKSGQTAVNIDPFILNTHTPLHNFATYSSDCSHFKKCQIVLKNILYE